MQPRENTIEKQKGFVGKPHEPVIRARECLVALHLMQHMADNIRESGDVPEEVVELLYQFRWRVDELSKRAPFKKALDRDTDYKDGAFDKLIWLLPTFSREHVTREHVGAAIVQLIEARANLAAYGESPFSGVEY